MVQRLEELGWIRRERSETDRRTFVLSLTLKGLGKIWRAMRRVFRRKVVRAVYEKLFRPRSPEPWDELAAFYDPSLKVEQTPWRIADDGSTEPRHVVHIIHDVYRTVRTIARWFGDNSYVWYDLGHRLPPR
jgi:hypothetical protein